MEGVGGGHAEGVGDGVSSRRRCDISWGCHCKRRGTGVGEQAGFCLSVEMDTLAEQCVKSLVAVTEGPTCGIAGGVVGFVAGLTHCKENLSDDGIAFTHSPPVTIINRRVFYRAAPAPAILCDFETTMSGLL